MARAQRGVRDGGDVRIKWTKEETNTLVSMWPSASLIQIANALHRTHTAIRGRVAYLRKKGLLLKAKRMPRNPSIKPDPQDLDKAKRDYCHKQNISLAKLGVRLERKGKLVAELYRLAQAAKLTRLSPRHAARPEITRRVTTAGMTAEQNRAALAGKPVAST
jgi:hypothetical protein